MLDYPPITTLTISAAKTYKNMLIAKVIIGKIAKIISTTTFSGEKSFDVSNSSVGFVTT